MRCSTFLAMPSWPVEIHVSPQHRLLVGEAHGEAGGLEHLHRGRADPGVEVVGEGVRPEQHLPARPVPAGQAAATVEAAEPRGEPRAGEAGDGAAVVDAAGGLEHAVEPGGVRERVDRSRRQGRQPRPHRQPAHGVVRRRAQPPGVVVGEELGLVRGHVHVHGAVAATPLAGQAQVERLEHVLRPPAVGHGGVGVPVEHLEQQPRPAAGGVLLLAGGTVARAHHPPLAVRGVALAHPHAAQHRPLEAAVVVGVAEVQVLRVGRGPLRPEPQVGGERAGVDDLARVHQPVGVPDAAEPAHRLDELGPEHGLEERAAGLAVAVLARQRPAVADHEARRRRA